MAVKLRRRSQPTQAGPGKEAGKQLALAATKQRRQGWQSQVAI